MKPILALMMALTSLPIPVCGQIPVVIGDWGDQYRHGLEKPEYGWLGEGFAPVGALGGAGGAVVFVKSGAWDDYEYTVPVSEIIPVLTLGAWPEGTPVEGILSAAEQAAGRCLAAHLGHGYVIRGLATWSEDPWSTNWSFHRALVSFNRAIECDPGNVDAWYGKGSALYFLGEYEEAAQAYEEVIRLDPENPDALADWADARQAVEDGRGRGW
jgi:tetratricopeptide (TPR) repeat protein